LAGYLDAALPESTLALEKHLDDCASCREFVAAYQRTVRVARKALEHEGHRRSTR
jgi:anti-sigma factor RsiW